MKKYHKIETIFKRDSVTKKLIVGDFRNPTVEFLKNVIWDFSEKVDGTNIRIFWDGHSVQFGGRTDEAQIPKHLLSKLEEYFGGEINAQLFEQKFGETPVLLYGEGYGEKIQNGEGYINGVDFILFDVEINDCYLSRENVEDIGKYFNVEVVPIIFEGTLEEGINFVLNNRKSVIAKNGALLEGVVGRPKIEMRDRLGNRIIVKIKFKDFV